MRKQRTLEVGKWKIGTNEVGYDLVGLSLKDIRGRNFAMTRVDSQTFHELVPFDADNKPIDPAAVVRGVPSLYLQLGNIVYLYPAPAHRWILNLDYLPKSRSPSASSAAANPLPSSSERADHRT